MSAHYLPQIIHRLPGRIRLSLPRIRSNPRLAAHLEVLLGKQAGIRECRAHPKAGSFLVLYDEALISEQDICRLLHTASADTSLSPNFRPPKKKQPFALEHMSIPTQIVLVVLGGFTLAFHLLHYLRGRGRGPRILPADLQRQTVIVTALTALPIFRSGLEGLLIQRKLNNEILIGTATLLALLLGEGATGLIVVWLINLSTLVETLTLDRSRRTIRTMLEGTQKDAWIVVDGQEISIPLTQLQQNDIVSVKVGGKLPVDGTILEGTALVNQAALTGEPLSVCKRSGDRVLAGSTIEQGTLYVRAEKVGDQTSVARIIHLVEQAAKSRAPIQTIADTYSARIIPASFLLAFVVFLLTRDIRRTMTILIVACPCAAGLATPTALSAAIGNAAGRGILVKGGRYLEEAGKVNFILFDKTGTLTAGKPTVQKIISVDKRYSAKSLLSLAAAAEANATHPLANAIKEAAIAQGSTIPALLNSEMIIGRGVNAMLDGVPIYVGNALYLNELGIKIPPSVPALIQELEQTATLVYIARRTSVIGLIAIQDTLRPNATAAIRKLRTEGILDIGIVTGDTDAAVSATARQLGLTKFWSDMLPQDKFQLVQALKAEGYIVGMVGDGVNDSPSLALANIGIAMGVGGSDAAIETAGIVLREDNPEKIVEIIRLGKRSLAIIRQNFLFAIGANIIGLGLGSARLISPLFAAILHNASTLAVVLNSTRLLTYAPAAVSEEPAPYDAENDRYALAYQPDTLSQDREQP